MKTYIFLLILLPINIFGQIPIENLLEMDKPDGSPEIYYYKFYNGVQMVELDYFTACQKQIAYLERTQPRALEWSMEIHCKTNVYLFRDTTGKIVKQFGEIDTVKLLNVEKTLKFAQNHNAFELYFGVPIGRSQFQTRYVPYYLIGSEGSFGLIDSLGNEVVPREYRLILRGYNSFITQNDFFYEARDGALNLLFKRTYPIYPAEDENGFIKIYEKGKYGLLDSKGKMIVKCKYDKIDRFNFLGLAEVSRNNLYGYVDKKGKEIVECKYIKIYFFRDDLARVKIYKDKKVFYGYIDSKGSEIIPPKYEDAQDFENGYAKVMVNGKWITIDTSGEIK